MTGSSVGKSKTKNGGAGEKLKNGKGETDWTEKSAGVKWKLV
jgi:hypothetical protein